MGLHVILLSLKTLQNPRLALKTLPPVGLNRCPTFRVEDLDYSFSIRHAVIDDEHQRKVANATLGP